MMYQCKKNPFFFIAISLENVMIKSKNYWSLMAFDGWDKKNVPKKHKKYHTWLLFQKTFQNI